MTRIKQALNGFLFTGFAILLVSFAGCSGEGGSILDSFISSEPKLQSLNTSLGTLCPVFDPDTLNYSLEVPADAASVNLIPKGINSKLNIAVLADSIKLDPDGNIINIPLTRSRTSVAINVSLQTNTKIKKQYIVEINKLDPGEKSSNANLSGLTIVPGTLSPAFNPISTAYNVEVPKSTDSITVTPVAAGVGAVIKVNGVIVETGKESLPIASTQWTTPVMVVVTAEDGTTIQSYSIDVSAVSGNASSNTNLTELILSEGTLSPAFHPNKLN